MPRESFGEQLWRGLGDAVADIREKVVEEPMWGRVVTERGEAPEWPQAREAEPSAHEGLSGETLGPESQPMNTHDNAGLLQHGFVIDAEPMNRESSPSWTEATRALTYNPQHEQDKDIDR
jgi:hypothetical protein